MWEEFRLCADGCRDFQYWTTLSSSICSVCVPRSFGVVFVVENEDLPKGLKADGKGKGWCGCRRTGKGRESGAAHLYPAFLRNGCKSGNWSWGGDWIAFWVDEFFDGVVCLHVLRGPLTEGSPFPGVGLQRLVLNVNSNKCGYKTTGAFPDLSVASATCHVYPKVHLNFTSSSGSYSEFFQ